LFCLLLTGSIGGGGFSGKRAVFLVACDLPLFIHNALKSRRFMAKDFTGFLPGLGKGAPGCF